MFNYSKIECQEHGVMFYNVMFNEDMGPYKGGDIVPYAYLSFDKGTIVFGEDVEEGKETVYEYEFHILTGDANE
jgi:hypothetical protein